MSVEAIAWALKQKTGDPATKIVLICLANYAGVDGSCFPSHTTIAKQTEQSARSVKRKIKELEKRDLIKHLRTKRQDGGWSTNMYYLSVYK